MAKLTKKQLRLHNDACNILKKEFLSFEDKVFVLENWNEAADFEVNYSGAFFTPSDLAADFAIEVPSSYRDRLKCLDMCAGIGVLSFWVYHRAHSDTPPIITCVERNPHYVEIGKKLLPEATWICADIFEFVKDIKDQNFYDYVYSNPPYGRNVTTAHQDNYDGKLFEYKIIELGLSVADYGVFLIPQGSAPFNYSGRYFYDRREDKKYKKFSDQTGIYLEAGCGIDTSCYDDFKNTKIITEVVTAEHLEIEICQVAPNEQMSLFVDTICA